MQQLNRKIIALFLLVLVLAPLSYLCLSEIRQQQIRNEMREKLEEESLQTLVLEAAAVKWFEPGREILIGDRLFDIKETLAISNEHIAFTGLYDEDETRLVKQLNETRENDISYIQTLASLFQLLNGADLQGQLFSLGSCTIVTTHACKYNSPLPVVYHNRHTPPPQKGIQIS